LTTKTPRPLPLRFFLGLATALACACGESEEPAAPPAAAPKEKPAAPPPEIDAAVKKRLDDDVKQSREWVEQARELKKKGIELERSSGTGAGKPSFNDAATLYKKASDTMSNWTEPTSLEVSLNAEQRAYYITPLANERQTWIMEAATLVPLLQRK
jgi:hypothetical protein